MYISLYWLALKSKLSRCNSGRQENVGGSESLWHLARLMAVCTYLTLGGAVTPSWPLAFLLATSLPSHGLLMIWLLLYGPHFHPRPILLRWVANHYTTLLVISSDFCINSNVKQNWRRTSHLCSTTVWALTSHKLSGPWIFRRQVRALINRAMFDVVSRTTSISLHICLRFNFYTYRMSMWSVYTVPTYLD